LECRPGPPAVAETVGAALAFSVVGWTRPLTQLEKRFLKPSGHAPYEGPFVERYLQPVVYPKGMSRTFELVAGVSVLVWNALADLGILYLN